MEARVKSTWPLRALQALAGQEFIKDEFRPVAPGFEAEAKRHPYLEVRETKSVSVETVVEVLDDDDFIVPPGFRDEAFPAPIKSVSSSKPHTTLSKGKGGKK